MMRRINYAWIGAGVCCAASMAACASPDAPVPAADAGDGPAWSVVWQDDFDGAELDPAKWSPEVSCWGGGNDERQCYTGRTENVRVEDGVLVLAARAETYRGPLHHAEPGDGVGDEVRETREQAYTSGKVRTKGLASWRYGRFSARMKLPSGQGTWPALWMMPEDAAYGRWPLSGELDIMEAVNLGTPCDECANGVENRTSGALHFGDVAPDNTYLFAKADGTETGTPADDWHVYAAEWSADTIQWFVDGEIFMRLTADDWHTASEAADGRPNAPFDRPFFLMANLAVGGNLPEKSNGAGFDADSFPAELLIDWVKVERCEGGGEDGGACLSDAEWDGTPQGPWEVQAR